MTSNGALRKTMAARTLASKILADIPYMNGFHFYAAYGNYTEETASNLCEFAETLRTID